MPRTPPGSQPREGTFLLARVGHRVIEGRWMATAPHRRRAWERVPESDEAEHVLVVITAYPVVRRADSVFKGAISPKFTERPDSDLREMFAPVRRTGAVQ